MPKERGIDYMWDIYCESLIEVGVPRDLLQGLFPSFIAGASAAVCLMEAHGNPNFTNFLQAQLDAHIEAFKAKTKEFQCPPRLN